MRMSFRFSKKAMIGEKFHGDIPLVYDIILIPIIL